MRIIWGAYAALALVVALFAGTIYWIRPDVGTVVLTTILLGASGTAVGVVLLGASMLGTRALMKEPAFRRPFALASVVAGWLGAAFLGWIAWGFWTR